MWDRRLLRPPSEVVEEHVQGPGLVLSVLITVHVCPLQV